jgi:hypothetical protein
MSDALPQSDPRGLGKSYDDVCCIYNGKRVRIADSYAFELRCTRAGGWSLWHVWGGIEQRLAEEFGEPRLQIEVRGVRIL